MIHVIDYETKRTLLCVDLSDCWTYNGKRVWFRLCKLQSPINDDVQAITFIIGPLSVKFGWITSPSPREENFDVN
jgi:hypothetical protein